MILLSIWNFYWWLYEAKLPIQLSFLSLTWFAPSFFQIHSCSEAWSIYIQQTFSTETWSQGTFSSMQTVTSRSVISGWHELATGRDSSWLSMWSLAGTGPQNFFCAATTTGHPSMCGLSDVSSPSFSVVSHYSLVPSALTNSDWSSMSSAAKERRISNLSTTQRRESS